MITDLLVNVFSGVVSGGATGLLGMGIQIFADIKKREHDLLLLAAQNTQALELRKIDAAQEKELATLSAESADRLATLQAQARADETTSADYLASHASDRATYLAVSAQDIPLPSAGPWAVRAAVMTRVLMALVDTFRGIIRPGVTLYSMVLLTLMLYWVRDLYDRAGLRMTDGQAMQLAGEVISTTTYITTTVVVWWFGRRPEQPPKKG